MKDLITKLAVVTPKPVCEDGKVPTQNADGNWVCPNAGSGLEANISSILSGIIGALGLVCVVVMIIGGVQYMTSAGDSSKVKTAKNTILYGLIGLVICVLAFAIVNWIIPIATA